MAASFKWGEATISAKELTIGDEEDIGVLMLRLGEDTKTVSSRYGFAEFMFAAEIEGGEPPLPMVTPEDSDADIQAAFTKWRNLPRRFVRQWRETLQAVETSPKP